MKKVKGVSYLYLRNGVFVFRRGVPLDARQAFGGRYEAHKSLGATDLSEARHLMVDELRSFEAKLAQARGVLAPLARLQRAALVPSNADMEAGAREWTADRTERLRNELQQGSIEDEAASLRQLSVERQFLDAVAAGETADTSLDTDWIATSIVDRNGWEVSPNSPAYRFLRRLVARAQIEVRERARQELSGAPVRVLDERFSAEHYVLDQARKVQAKPPVSLRGLIASYIAERRPAAATQKAYKLDFAKFCEFLGHDEAQLVSPHDVVRWKDTLQQRVSRKGTPLSARTIRDKYLAVIKTVFSWATENHLLDANPADRVRIRGQHAPRLRDKGLTDGEATLILEATKRPYRKRITPEREFARQWVPWICAYTGARVNEITQLRAQDILKVEGKRPAQDRTTVVYNSNITITGIPLEAYDYVVNGKPALVWVCTSRRVADNSGRVAYCLHASGSLIGQ